MTRAGRIEERQADRLDKYRRGAAKESLWGTPCVIGNGSDSTESIRTDWVRSER